MAIRKTRRAKRTARPARARKKTSASKKSAPARRQTASRESSAAAQPERRQAGRQTLRLRSFEPSFTVSDIERSIRFYTDALGFIVGQRWTGDGGKLLGVMLKAGVCEIGLSQDDWAKGRERTRGEAVRINCVTAQDIDGLAQRIKAAGGRLTQEPKDQEWGGRSLAVDDPDGFHLTIYRLT